MAFGDWLKALGRTRRTILSGFTRLVGSGRPSDDTLDQIEESLLGADIPPRLAALLVEEFRDSASGDDWRLTMRRIFLKSFDAPSVFDWHLHDEPTVILIVGVNGSGKTTTAAKLAKMAAGQGLKPLLGAADTFRAAGSEQLKLWANRVGCDVVGGREGSDAAAVAFDALQAAVARRANIVFIDTAGRMHTKRPLMDELIKIKRSLSKAVPGAPHQTWMVLDAALGNNALRQAEVFDQHVGIDGIIVSKLDGSAKAGFLMEASRALKAPVLFAGLGEEADDLAVFDPEAYVDALLGADENV